MLSASSSTSESLPSGSEGQDSPRRLRVATRSSPLALRQAAAVGRMLSQEHPGLGTEAVPIRTEGDRLATAPLADIGGKGVFVRALQAAVLDGTADLAVHSAKDLPSQTPEGLCLAAVPRRGEVRDALVGSRLADLGEGAVVATGSARRRVQLADRRPDLRFADLRGNIDTRLAKAADFDAVVMALAALERLERRPPVLEALDVDLMVPQVGQGALAVECRAGDRELRRLLAAIEDPASRRCVDAERAFLAALGGDCTVPAGAHARLAGGEVHMRGVLAPAVGEPLRRAALSDGDAARAGLLLAELLTGQG
ncbi:MAG: hydroxymethylbilane synthase [bacterium]|nr:hydroxymethylbilane synthase [bacterium]